MESQRKRRALSWGIGLGILVIVSSIIVTNGSLQLVVTMGLLLLAVISQSRKRVLVIAALLVPVLGFVRRLLAGEAGRTDFDPLVVLPVLLVGIIVIISLMKRTKRSSLTSQRVSRIVYLFIAFVMLSVLLNTAFGFESIYFSLAITIPMLLVASVSDGRVTDVWPTVERFVPLLAIIVGAYGVWQFFVLPEWDRNWMMSSELTSIGHPEPTQVRVFGMSESPGPYALFLGLAILVCLSRAADSKIITSFGWYLVALGLLVPLLLTGVRSALIGVLICAALIVVVRGKGLGRLLPLGLIGAAGWFMNNIISSFGNSSTILNADRYTNFEVGSDDSVQARLGLFKYLMNPFPHVIGNPDRGEVDNLMIDILLNYGVVPMALMSVFMVFIFILSIRLLRSRVSGAAGLCAVYIVIAGFTGNFFISTFGVLAGMVLASVLRANESISPIMPKLVERR